MNQLWHVGKALGCCNLLSDVGSSLYLSQIDRATLGRDSRLGVRGEIIQDSLRVNFCFLNGSLPKHKELFPQFRQFSRSFNFALHN